MKKNYAANTLTIMVISLARGTLSATVFPRILTNDQISTVVISEVLQTLPSDPVKFVAGIVFL
jgi:hypothetical protein